MTSHPSKIQRIYKCDFMILPDEVWSLIFLHFEIPILYETVSMVNKRFNNILKSAMFLENWGKSVKKTYDFSDLPKVIRDYGVFKKEYLRLMKKSCKEYVLDMINELYHDKKPFYIHDMEKEQNDLGKIPYISKFYVYKAVYEDKYYWHYLTYGLSEEIPRENVPEEVLEKSWAKNRNFIQFDLEYSIKLLDENSKSFDDMKSPPEWIYGFLNYLAGYQFGSGRAFLPGHKIPCNSPIKEPAFLELPTLLTAIAFRLDKSLPLRRLYNVIDDEVGFLELCPFTTKESDVSRMWSTMRMMDLVYGEDKPAVFSIYRGECLDEENMKIVEKGMEKEGSKCSSLNFLHNCEIEVCKPNKENGLKKKLLSIRVWKQQYDQFVLVLKSRICFGNDFMLIGTKNIEVYITPVESERLKNGDFMKDFCSPVPHFFADKLILVVEKKDFQTEEFKNVADRIEIETQDYKLVLEAIHGKEFPVFDEMLEKLQKELNDDNKDVEKDDDE